jgi:hypothetical protein
MKKFQSSNGAIDWSKLAEPQEDQYDTNVTLTLATTTTSPARPQRYVRKPIGDSTAIFDGQVAVRHVYRSVPEFQMMLRRYRYSDAPENHPNISKAVEHVRSWPVGFAQCQRLLEAIHPLLHPGFSLESDEIYRGSLSHSYEHLFGTIWATIFCPIGLAESIVHEMAHQKLRVLGVSFEAATTIVGNDPNKLYVSPVIKDRLRPMTAVLHAEYSFVYVTTLNIHMLQTEGDPIRRHVLGQVLQSNLSRIEEGYGVIQDHFQPAEHGEEFLNGFSNWIEKTISSARKLLAGKSQLTAE